MRSSFDTTVGDGRSLIRIPCPPNARVSGNDRQLDSGTNRAGRRDRSRAPHHCPHRIDDAVAELLCAARRRHRVWGPERMDKTLKRGAIRPSRPTLAAQQRAFDRFRALYNAERPHKTLGGRTPASRYRPSPRPYPDPLPAIEYPGHFLVREITAAGTFRFGDRLVFLSNALRHYPVGLEEPADGIWSVYFCHGCACSAEIVGRIVLRGLRLHVARPRAINT